MAGDKELSAQRIEEQTHLCSQGACSAVGRSAVRQLQHNEMRAEIKFLLRVSRDERKEYLPTLC